MDTSNQEPPKTSEAMGVHIVYISKAISEIKSTLKEIQLDAVGRLEFDEHVIWGKDTIKDHETRITNLEDCKLVDDNSMFEKIKKSVADKAVAIIVILIFAMLFIALSKASNNNLFNLL